MKQPTEDTIGRMLDLIFEMTLRPACTRDLADVLGIAQRSVNRDICRLRRAGVKITRLSRNRYCIERDWWRDQFNIRSQRG